MCFRRYEDEQYFNINYKGGLNFFTTLIKIQTGLEGNKITKEFNENFTLKKEKVRINTIDNYLKSQNIEFIDIVRLTLKATNLRYWKVH